MQTLLFVVVCLTFRCYSVSQPTRNIVLQLFIRQARRLSVPTDDRGKGKAPGLQVF